MNEWPIDGNGAPIPDQSSQDTVPLKKKRGRPLGSKNKPKPKEPNG